MVDKKYEIEYISVDLIFPNPWNPNEESDNIFNMLVDSISEEGCDEPILVVEIAPKLHYRIISGEHRFEGSKKNGLKEVPCIVKRDKKWRDENFQKTEVVKRNNLRGKLNDEKFTEIMNGLLEEDDSLSYEELAYRTAFESEKDLLKHLLKQQEDEDREVRQYSKKEEDNNDLEDIDIEEHHNNLVDIVDQILENHKSGLKNGGMWFFYGGEKHLYVNINEELKELIDGAVKMSKSGKKLESLFIEGLEKIVK